MKKIYSIGEAREEPSIKLATNQSQFQSIVGGYNYTMFYAGINNTSKTLDFVLYNGSLAKNSPAKIVEVFEDVYITKVLGIKEYQAHTDYQGTLTIGALPTPLKQIQSGRVFPMNIRCNFDYVAVKDHTGDLLCFKPQTAQKLVARGWGILAETKSYNINIQRIGVWEKKYDPWYDSIQYNNVSDQTLSQLPTIQMAMTNVDMLYQTYVRNGGTSQGCGECFVQGPPYFLGTTMKSDEGKLALKILNLTDSDPITNPNYYSAYIQYNLKNYSIAIDTAPLFHGWSPWR